MGLYRKFVLPHLIDLSMKNPGTTQCRSEISPKATGRVLEIGVGSGRNFPFYSAGVSHVWGIVPSPELLAMARASAEAVEHASGREDELRRVVEAQSATGDFAAALETAAGIHELPARAAALAAIALARAESGEHRASHSTLAAAEETVRQIEYREGRTEALPLIARTRARLGAFPLALETAHAIADEVAKVETLQEIASLQSSAGERDAVSAPNARRGRRARARRTGRRARSTATRPTAERVPAPRARSAELRATSSGR